MSTAPVTLGPIVDGLRVVRTGLSAGELIVVNGLQRVRPGVTVEPAWPWTAAPTACGREIRRRQQAQS